ncbi:MAG: biotin--[acetyl-CoA-carboxylase] ligase [Pseudomonadota bacterium]
MKPLLVPLLRKLSDGHFHSGENLASALGVSRATVWQALSEAAEYGLQIFRVRGRGYQLISPIDLLDCEAVMASLGLDSPFNLQILDSVNSTNSFLLQRAHEGAVHGDCVATELQTHGRGRLGRAWHTGLASALTFSVLWQFKCGIAGLSGLSLAVGLAVARGCEALSVTGVKLKWPNDVIHNGRKLAGILIEVQGEMLGPSTAVIGIGINHQLSSQVLAEIDQAVVDLAGIANPIPSRNVVLAELLRALNDVLTDFEAKGFSPLISDWEARHAYQTKLVQLMLPDRSVIRGVAEGVAADGALKIRTSTGPMQFSMGEISMRGI